MTRETQKSSLNTVLVTGGSGLVGHAIAWASRQQAESEDGKHERFVLLSRKDGDLRNYNEAEAIFKRHSPDIVIHLAARVGGLFANQAQPVDFLTDNLAIDSNILRLCHEFKVKKLLAILSTCIFPDGIPPDQKLTEDIIHLGPPHHSNFGYAHAKRMLHVGVQAYRQQHGSSFNLVIPTNIYGPHDNFSDTSHVIAGLTKRIVAAKRAGLPSVTIPGSGKALRQFIYSRDLARLVLRLVESYDDAKSVILAPDESDEISIFDLVGIIVGIIGYEGKIEWDTGCSDGQLRKTADNTHMKQVLTDVKFTPIRQGLEETIGWYIENEEPQTKL